MDLFISQSTPHPSHKIRGGKENEFLILQELHIVLENTVKHNKAIIFQILYHSFAKEKHLKEIFFHSDSQTALGYKCSQMLPKSDMIMGTQYLTKFHPSIFRDSSVILLIIYQQPPCHLFIYNF